MLKTVFKLHKQTDYGYMNMTELNQGTVGLQIEIVQVSCTDSNNSRRNEPNLWHLINLQNYERSYRKYGNCKQQ